MLKLRSMLRRASCKLAFAVVLACTVLPGWPVLANSGQSALFAGWINGSDPAEPEMQVQALDADTFVIRQSVRTNFEAPFLYLLFGKDKALLLDTGAGGLRIRSTIDHVIDGWLRAHRRTDIPLIVAHTHAHRDHIAGDEELRSRPMTTVIGLSPREVAAFFSVDDWPNGLGSIDLGHRRLTIIPTPGHEPSHIMVYDPRRKMLLSGDALYPGRLYVPVNHMNEERASIDRVVAFVGTHPVRTILGAHIEMTDQAGRDYKKGVDSHPDEHRLELPGGALLELQQGLRAPLDEPGVPQTHDDFIIYPLKPN